jgi:hypothetical protein
MEEKEEQYMPPVPPYNRENMQLSLRNASVKISILDGMRIMVFFICLIATIMMLAGLFSLNSGIWDSSAEYYDSGRGGTEIVTGFVDMIIGAILFIAVYFFMKRTVESREWWKRLR